MLHALTKSKSGPAPPAGDVAGPTPPSGDIAAFGAVDNAAEQLFGRLRGQPVVDMGAIALSNLSDYGLVWVVLAALKARRPGPGRRRAVASLFCSGVLSYSVNKAAKSLVGRERPEGATRADEHDVVPVRPPSSSSFPSGHTLAAFATAVALADGPAERAGYLGFAAAVAASRVHLRAHHASDVLGGAAIGVAVGVIARTLVRAMPGISR